MKYAVKVIPTLAALVVGVASFVLSFVALRDVAASVGAVPADLAWLVPIVVDGGILAGSASLWAASYQHARRDPIAYLTVGSLLAFSVVVNINHAADGALAKAIAALPPIVLLACLELVAATHRADVTRRADSTRASATPASEQAEPRNFPAHASHQTGEPARVENGRQVTTSTSTATKREVASLIEEPTLAAPSRPAGKDTGSKAEFVRNMYDTMVLEGEDPTDPKLVGRLAQAAGVSDTYVRRLIKPMRETRVKADTPDPIDQTRTGSTVVA